MATRVLVLDTDRVLGGELSRFLRGCGCDPLLAFDIAYALDLAERYSPRTLIASLTDKEAFTVLAQGRPHWSRHRLTPAGNGPIQAGGADGFYAFVIEWIRAG